MKKIFIIINICVWFFCITGCKESISNSNNNTNQIEVTETNKTMEGNEIMSVNSQTQEIKVIYDKDKKLKAVALTKEEKDKLFSDFLKNRFNIYMSKNNDIKTPSETKITKNFDEYNDVCYSIYKYNKNKLFAFLLREKPDLTKSSNPSNVTVYEGLFLIPIDKVYTMEDFSGIVVNKSDLSDVKKIYKYADTLLKQELQFENSKKKCSINVMSKDSGITISFKKSGDKYIVTDIKDNADESLVSMIADVDKNFD